MNKKQRNALITIAIGAIIWFMPVPAGVTVVAWHLAAVFIATVVGFILQPLPIGAVAFIAITFSTLSGLLKVGDALSGYGNSTIWLIVCAFLYSRGFIKSGLGKRIAFGIIKAIGKSALSLGYAIAFSELIISPATPSATKPELVSIPDAKQLAQKELDSMGPMSRSEKYLTAVFLGSLFFWATSGLTHIGATPVAMAAVCIMIIFDVINWKDVLSEKGAWDAMFWMGSLMTLASALILLLFYTYIHYCFASVTARISALYAAFIAVSVAVGALPLMTAIIFGIFADVPISLTHYGNGCAPIYYGAGYVSQSEWWKNGFVMTTITTVIYLTIGAAWWKVIGLW